MSQPTFPVTNELTREEVVNQILSSIAMEELGLSHIVNAEGEKLQYLLGTLPGVSGPGATVDQVLQVNTSVQKMLQATSNNQMFLKSKMSGALKASLLTGPTGPIGPAGPAGGVTGSTGAAGAAGAPGLAGATGSAGVTGAQGFQGMLGVRGPQGPAGPQGFQGSAGARGSDGQMGARGAAGIPSYAFATIPAAVHFDVGNLLNFSDNQFFSPAVSISADNTSFTVADAGLYFLSYQVSLSMNYNVLRIDLEVSDSDCCGFSTFIPGAVYATVDHLCQGCCALMMPLGAGSSVRLRVSAYIPPDSVTLSSGNSFTIVKVD